MHKIKKIAVLCKIKENKLHEIKGLWHKMKKAFSDCDNCIVMAANEDFVPCMSVMLQSVIEHSNPKNKYDIIILYSDISRKTQDTVIGMIKNRADYFSIRFLDVRKYIRFKRFYTKNKRNFSKEAYYRLFIPWILDEEYQYALCLDGDMIVQRDIYELFSESIGDCLIGAVRDYEGICKCYIPEEPKRGYRESIGLTDIDSYITGATLMMNLSGFRKSFTMKKILHMATSKRWKQHDQDVINVICKGKIYLYSPVWGYVTDFGNNTYLPQYLRDELSEAEAAPYMIHFAGGRKPWLYPYHRFGDEFWRCAKKTPFFEELLMQIRQFDYRYYVACSLNGEPLVLQDTELGPQYIYSGISIGGLNDGISRYRIIDVCKNQLRLEGLVGIVGNDDSYDIEVYAEADGKKYKADSQKQEDGFREEMQYLAYHGESFVINIPLKNIKDDGSVKLLCKINGRFYDRTDLSFGKFCSLSRMYPHSYCIKGNRIVKTDGSLLYVTKKTVSNCFFSERRFLCDLLKKKRYKAVAARRIVFLIRPFFKKPIWLISDRLSRADDNGEAFFKYLNRFHKDEINSYFVIRKDAPDYERMQQYGRVLDSGSAKFRILQLMAECSISSQTDRIFRDAFRIRESYCDLIGNIKFIFLQHGVIVSDLSKWLNKSNQQLDGFVTSTEDEYRLIANGEYGYTDEIWLTGMPRFDYLEDRQERVVTILPTWRKYLTVGKNTKNGVWRVVNNFHDSEYASFYRNLMHNDRLRRRAKELNYRIQFKIHPTYYGEEDSFGFDKDVALVPKETSYKNIFETSSLLVTDYSSSIFDFIYLGKPVFYCHFDFERFFAGDHSYKYAGYDYEKKGFGEVEYTLEKTVDRIIEYMEHDCCLKPKYRERIEKAFRYHDKNNCQRVYEKIIALRDKEI